VSPLDILIQITRIAVFAFFGYTCVVAVASWAVRTRRLNPFGRTARAVRRLSEPLMRPLERRIVRSGGNPQDAPLWLVGIAVVGGLIMLSVVTWAGEAVYNLLGSIQAGPRGVLRLVVGGLFSLVMGALLVRVVASWIGASRYRPWMRPVVWLTDWIIDPIQRVLPPLGPLDFSPMVAYLLLWLARSLVLGWL
jgi:YggT family protein